MRAKKTVTQEIRTSGRATYSDTITDLDEPAKVLRCGQPYVALGTGTRVDHDFHGAGDDGAVAVWRFDREVGAGHRLCTLKYVAMAWAGLAP